MNAVFCGSTPFKVAKDVVSLIAVFVVYLRALVWVRYEVNSYQSMDRELPAYAVAIEIGLHVAVSGEKRLQ